MTNGDSNRRRARRWRALALLVCCVALLGAACSRTPSDAPQNTAGSSRIPMLNVGQTATNTDGASVRVYQVERPARVDGSVPALAPGQEWLAVEVAECASDSAPAGRVTPARVGDFQLVLADGTQLGAVAARQPAFVDRDLTLGVCLRGWVSFQVPSGAAATLHFAGVSSEARVWRVTYTLP